MKITCGVFSVLCSFEATRLDFRYASLKGKAGWQTNPTLRKADVTQDDSQQRFLAQHNVAIS